MKRVLSVCVLAIMLIFTLSGCGDDESKNFEKDIVGSWKKEWVGDDYDKDDFKNKSVDLLLKQHDDRTGFSFYEIRFDDDGRYSAKRNYSISSIDEEGKWRIEGDTLTILPDKETSGKKYTIVSIDDKYMKVIYDDDCIIYKKE